MLPGTESKRALMSNPIVKLYTKEKTEVPLGTSSHLKWLNSSKGSAFTFITDGC